MRSERRGGYRENSSSCERSRIPSRASADGAALRGARGRDFQARVEFWEGTRTVYIQDSKFARGPIALQYGAGVVKFRKVQIRPL